jgi:hypothetical protein
MDPVQAETITITRAEYDDLVEKAEWLEYLEQAGVDNWEGYEFALELSREQDA